MWRWLTSQCRTHSDIALLGRLMKLMLFFTAALSVRWLSDAPGQRISPPALVPTGYFQQKAESELG
jgi:hypothetical protein